MNEMATQTFCHDNVCINKLKPKVLALPRDTFFKLEVEKA